MSIARRCLAEFLGTLLLLACVVGSGVMGVNLSHGNEGIALLANAGATAGMLYVLISILGPISGAHFNPVVTATSCGGGEMSWRDGLLYVVVQLVGAVLGVALAHAMFELPLVQPGTHARAGVAQIVSEGVATFGLVITIALAARDRPRAVPALVAAYIFAAYWFTASTSFANPAVTLARSLTQTFAGIRPQDTGGFILGQVLGAALAVAVARILLNDRDKESTRQSGALQSPLASDSRETPLASDPRASIRAAPQSR
jgi:glycerol uptake facilitator-like aquaporin